MNAEFQIKKSCPGRNSMSVFHPKISLPGYLELGNCGRREL